MKTFDKQFNYHIVLSNKHISVGDVFFCFLEAEKYLTKQNIIDCSLIYVEEGFFDRIIKNMSNDNGLASCIQENKNKVIIKNRQEMQEKLVVELKKRYKVPKKIIAITGTKGKTSTAWYLSQIASSLKNCRKCGYIGTLGVYLFQDGYVKDKIETDDHLTTPSIDMMYRYLDVFVNVGVEIVVFEASSHAIFQNRLDGINVDVACFTNLSQDHLDYHRTMEDYFEAKLKLFTEHLKDKSNVILNNDDDYSKKIVNSLYKNNSRAGIKLITSITSEDINDIKNLVYDVLRIDNVKQNRRMQSVEFSYNGLVFNFNTNIIGEFQCKNLLMAMLAVNALYQDTSIEELCKKIPKIKAPLGRLQRVDESNVFIDYAHAPKPLEECLQLLRTLYDNIIVVFGCGGDRDKKKRPIMFEIAKRLANTVIITSDNPRNEKPIDIINDILCIEKNNKKNPLASDEFVINEIKKIDLHYSKLINYNEEGAKNLIVKEDRGDAIAVAVKIYKDSDIDNTAVLIAGKGHENYQIVGNEIKHFDDYEEAVKYLKKS